MASNLNSSPTRQLIIDPQMIIPSANCGKTSVVHSPATEFVLRLTDHQKELHRFFWNLFDNQSFTDVTIILDDGHYINAHKLVLCAFSVYFRQVLTSILNPCEQTIIVVKDMNYEDVRCLIEFMYRGCVTVPDIRLQQLLKCAKELKIRGLYEMNEQLVKENTPVLPQKSQNALDLSTNNNFEQFLPMSTIDSSPSVCHPGFTSHPSLCRSTSVDECQLTKHKSLINGINGKPKRGPSSLDGHLDSNNNDLEPDDNRKEKKRNQNIIHATKYRNRKQQQLKTLFNEETELQRKNCLAKVEIEKLESTILSLIWQNTIEQFQSQTVFICPVCGNVQNQVQKLRNHINMLHNDTEALIKFLMLQRSLSFTTTAINGNNNSTNPVVVQNSTVSMPIIVQNIQKAIN